MREPIQRTTFQTRFGGGGNFSGNQGKSGVKQKKEIIVGILTRECHANMARSAGS